jgi:hypothetical protein
MVSPSLMDRRSRRTAWNMTTRKICFTTAQAFDSERGSPEFGCSGICRQEIDIMVNKMAPWLPNCLSHRPSPPERKGTAGHRSVERKEEKGKRNAEAAGFYSRYFRWGLVGPFGLLSLSHLAGAVMRRTMSLQANSLPAACFSDNNTDQPLPSGNIVSSPGQPSPRTSPPWTPHPSRRSTSSGRQWA